MADTKQSPVNLSSKDSLISLLNGARAAFLYGFFVEALAHKHVNVLVAAAGGGNFRFEHGEESIGLDLGVLAEQLAEHSREIRGNFYLQLEHQSIRTFYDLTHTYCQKSGQTSVYAAKPFMQFARIWRNVVSHGDGAVLSVWPPKLKERGITEVTWRNCMLSESQVGTEVSLGIVDIIKLQTDIYDFCQKELQ